MERFWLVWNEDGDAPVCKHSSEQSARKEAERLARSVGGSFHVMGLLATCKKSDVVWQAANDFDDSEPFSN